MTLRESLLEELQKLRLSRERPIGLKQTGKVAKGKSAKDKKLVEDALRMLDEGLED